MDQEAGLERGDDPILVVGFPKAGSTAMFNLLSQHSAMSPAFEKENLALYPSLWEGRPARRAELDAYLAALPSRLGRPLEGAPANVFVHRRTVRQLAQRCPGGNIIAVVREPRERLASAYHFQRRRGVRHRSFAAFVRENIAGHDAGVAPTPGTAAGFHVTSGLYGRALEPWAEAFGDRLAIVDAANLRDDRAHSTMGWIVEWLGLASDGALRPGEWNRTPRPPGGWLRRKAGKETELPLDLSLRLDELHREDVRRLRAVLGPDSQDLMRDTAWVWADTPNL